MQFIESYNLIDLFIVGTLGITAILGIWKGFVRSLTALASLVVGVVLALRYYRVVQPYLGKISSLDPQISMILSMIIIFIAVQIVFVVVRRLLAALIDVTRLGWLDRILGAAMGLTAGFLVVAAAVGMILIGVPEWPVVKESRLVKPVDEAARKAMQFAPKTARDQLQSLTDQWKGTQGTAPAESPAKAVPPKSKPAAPQGVSR